MTTVFTNQVRAIIGSIPAGKVSTYGIIARAAGNPCAARQVAWVLHCSRNYLLPWHRVVNSRGHISLAPGQGHELQKQLLGEEGVVFSRHGQIDFSNFLWWPGGHDGAPIKDPPADGHGLTMNCRSACGK